MGKTKPKDTPAGGMALGAGISADLIDVGAVDKLPPALQSTLDQILLAIADTKTALQSQIGTVATELSLQRADHRKFVERVDEA